jgi:hypothetical protein
VIDFSAAATRALNATGRSPRKKDGQTLHKAIRHELMAAFNQGYELGRTKAPGSDIMRMWFPPVRGGGRFIWPWLVAVDLSAR